MNSFDAQALILAAPAAVWDVLTDTANFAVWNSGITEVSGVLRAGATIRVRTKRSGRKTLRFRVTLVPGSSITWTRWPTLGLGKITRTVSLSDHGGVTHLTVTETTEGFLPGHSQGARRDTGHVLEAFVEAVKFRAELLGHHLHGGVFPTPCTEPHGTSSVAVPRRSSALNKTPNVTTRQLSNAGSRDRSPN